MDKYLRVLVGATLVVSACSVSGEINIGGSGPVGKHVEDFIEGDFGAGFELGDLTASCTEPSSDDVGATFLCTATTTSGETVRLEATLSEDDTFEVETTNFVSGDSWGPVEETMVELLAETAQVDQSDISVDCGTDSIIFDIGTSAPHICAAADGSGSIFDLEIAFTSLVPGNILWDWKVGDIRP